MRIIGYSSIDRTLHVSPGPVTFAIPPELGLVLGDRGCAGRWEGSGYVACDRPDSPYCGRCYMPADPCVICRGECRKPEMTCVEPHSVYLAVFSPGLVKVGVTRAFRLETRLREQGADEGHEIARFPDGSAARRLERLLSEKFPARVPFEEKIREGPLDRGVLDGLLARYPATRSYSFTHYRKPLRTRPVVLLPKKGMALSGEVLGIKGQALVLEKHGTLYALNLDSLIGFDFESRKGKTNLQASLAGY